ncbi:MAG: alpha/beta fold hydrolase [Longimicrobiales bacterium]
MTEHRETIDGIEMRWIEEGAGMPVVLVHGIPTSPELWRYVIPRLHGVRALAWEMVGYGESMTEGAGRDISVAAQAGYLGQWMQHVGVESAVLVGHDLGGGVVQILAAKQPRRAAGLVLTNAIGYDSWPIPSVKAMRAVGGLLRHLPSTWLAASLRAFLARGHDDSAVASASADVHLPRYARSGGAAAFVRQIRSLDVHDTLAVQDRLKELSLPAAIVWGEADRFQKIDYGERFARDLNAPLDRIAGGKHFTPEDHPDEVAVGIKRVVSSV